MSRELITNTDSGEVLLQSIVERYRHAPLSTLETYVPYGLAAGDETGAIERDRQEELFINGEIHNPSINYPLLGDKDLINQLHTAERVLLDLMSESTDLAHNSDRESVLYDLLRFRRLEIGLLLLSEQLCMSELAKEDRIRLGQLYNRVNDELHGPIDKPRFLGLHAISRSKAEEALASQDSPQEVKDAAEYYLSHTGEINLDDEMTMPVTLDTASLSKISEMLTEYFSDFLAILPRKDKDEKLSIDEFADLFRLAHQTRGTGWGVRIQPGAKGVDSRQNERFTVIGDKRKLPDWREAVAVVLHEDIHVERREKAEKLGDPLLSGLGLPRYLNAEEGVTKIFEQAIKGRQNSGVLYYLQLGLAKGLDSSPRDFRDVYELEWRRRLFNEYLDSKNMPAQQVDKLKRKAYTSTLRIFRGTPGDIPGVVFTRDQAYFIGEQTMWEPILSIAAQSPDHQRQSLDFLLTAKYDPTNQLHVRTVQSVLHSGETK